MSKSSWSQFHADGESKAFLRDHSRSSFDQPKWIANINAGLPPGHGVAFSSPVIGEDGTIYVGTTRGRLAAVDSNGKVKWRKRLAGMNSPCAVSTPQSEMMEIYMLALLSRSLLINLKAPFSASHRMPL